MNRLIALITVILCVAVIVFGHWHWKNEIEQNAVKAEAQTESNLSDTSLDQSKNKVESKQDNKEKDSEKNVDIDKLTQNLPDDVKGKITSAQGQKKPLAITIAGGHAITGLGELFQTRLDKTYGEGAFKVTEVNFEDKDSLDIYQNKLYEQITEGNPDIVIFTPPLINDTGMTSTRDSANVPVLVNAKIHNVLPETVMMVEPPNPVTYNAAMNDRIGEVESSAETAGIDYIDLLSAWPTDVGLDADLDNKGMYPNEKGLALWADALANFFTSQN